MKTHGPIPPTQKKTEIKPLAAPLVSRKELYEMIRKQIEHEDNLVNHRLNWLLASQAFLFTAFFGVLAKDSAQTTGVSPAITAAFLITIIGAGIYLSVFSFHGINAASDSLRRLRKTWYDPYPSEEERQELGEGFPPITWVGKFHAIDTARWFPIVVIGIWVILVIILFFYFYKPA